MVYPPSWLDRLQKAPEIAWEGVVYRHMFGDIHPSKTNVNGARWNPRDTEAIYTSCERETALSEAEYYISLNPLSPKAKRVVYSIHVSLRSVLDLRSERNLADIGITAASIADADFTQCQNVGGAVAWLNYDGLLVPSARRTGGTNLVIYRQDLSLIFDIVATQVIAPDVR